MAVRPVTARVEIERWPLAAPFRLAGHTFETVEAVVVSLESEGRTGRGEAAGVYYKNDKPVSMVREIEGVRAAIEAGAGRESLPELLPPGGARNALDCALWDLEAKLHGRRVWQLAGLAEPRPIVTTFTCGADEPERMAARALAYVGARAIKLKLTGAPADADRVRAVREALPTVWLGVDANQSFTRPFLERLMAVLVEKRVALIEQPFATDQDALLEGFRAPIPIAADESAQSCADIERLVGRYDMVNIKLDKCGGLTEALAMARAARVHGLGIMVGSMLGTSLGLAPAWLVAQLGELADLDAPIFLRSDRTLGAEYRDGLVRCRDTLWG
jgi:L-alanine-DL-glutamate epimerase-like enolase superfamily enzyme